MDILMRAYGKFSCEGNEIAIILKKFCLFITCLEISEKLYFIQTLCTANNGIIKT